MLSHLNQDLNTELATFFKFCPLNYYKANLKTGIKRVITLENCVEQLNAWKYA
jgi:hypothetical protein